MKLGHEATVLARRLIRAVGLPDDYTGSLTIHVQGGSPKKCESRHFGDFPTATMLTVDIDPRPDKDVA